MPERSGPCDEPGATAEAGGKPACFGLCALGSVWWARSPPTPNGGHRPGCTSAPAGRRRTARADRRHNGSDSPPTQVAVIDPDRVPVGGAQERTGLGPNGAHANHMMLGTWVWRNGEDTNLSYTDGQPIGLRIILWRPGRRSSPEYSSRRHR